MQSLGTQGIGARRAPSIPLIRASQLRPFLKGLARLNLPVQACFAQVHIPAAALDDPDMLIPALPLYRLLGSVAAEHGIPDLGFRLAEGCQVEEAGRIGRRVAAAGNLEGILETFIREVRAHSTIAIFWLDEADEDDVVFCRRGHEGVGIGAWQVEQYVLASMIQIVRLVQPTWRPEIVRLQSTDTPGLEHTDLLRGVAITRGHGSTELAVPRAMLRLPTRRPSGGAEAKRATTIRDEDFLETLKTALRPYVLGGYPDVTIGAELAAMSTRTLQRRLASHECTYSDLIAEIRFDISKAMLRDPKRRIMDIADALGYSAPGHFTRAFQRWAGMTPREFRRRGFAD